MGWFSVPSFVKNRRRTLAVVAGTVGTGYLLTKWAINQFQSMAASSAKGAVEYANLQRRFASAQADAEFTVLALLPTLGKQVSARLDLEGASRELAALVRREREEKAERERKEGEREERATAAEARRTGEPAVAGAVEGPPGEVNGGLTASMVEEGANLSASVTGSAPLNPAAAPFEPPTTLAATRSHSDSTAPTTPADPVDTTNEPTTPPSPTNEGDAAVEGGVSGSLNGDMSGSLSKSWAQVVVSGAGEASEAPPTAATIESSAAGTTPETSTAAEEPVAPSGPTKAELWHQIKILSFTRALTTLYLISLLAFQTHVQLSLLGRASYVAAVVAGLPAPDSPGSSQLDLLAASAEDDIEMAALAREEDAVEGGGEGGGGQAEVERLYLSVSWWLLHEGVGRVAERVRGAVEDVVGPLALKSTITYSALPGLLAQIRHRVEFDPTAPDARTSFLSVLLPPTPADLATTLASSAAPSSPSPTSSPPPARPAPPALLRLLDETADLLASPDGRLVQSLLMDRLVGRLVERVEPAFVPPPGLGAGGTGQGQGQGSRFEDVGEREVRLASLLPVVAREGQGAMVGNPNGYVEAVEGVRELHEFGAVVFGGWDRDAREGEGEGEGV